MSETKEIHVEIERSKVDDIPYVTSKLLEVCKQVIRDISDKNDNVSYEQLIQEFLPQFTSELSQEIPKKKRVAKKPKVKILSVPKDAKSKKKSKSKKEPETEPLTEKKPKKKSKSKKEPETEPLTEKKPEPLTEKKPKKKPKSKKKSTKTAKKKKGVKIVESPMP